MAVNQKRQPPFVVGWVPPGVDNGFSTLALSAAATWLSLAFTPDTSKTVSKVKLRASAVTGTLGANDLTCDVFSDTAGLPNVSLSSTNTVTATPTGAAWVEFTGLSQAVNAGTQYHLVFKNANGTPASNFPTYQFGAGSTGLLIPNGTTGGWGWYKRQTANSGTSWTTLIASSMGWRLEYSDGSFDGTPLEAVANILGSEAAQGSNEYGVVFVKPPGLWNVRGLSFYNSKVGSPAGNLRYRIYNNTALLGTTTAIPAANVVGTGWFTAYFANAIQISDGQTIRVSFGTTTGGDTSNYYRTVEATIENTAGSKALMPFGTNASPTSAAKKSTFNGTSWTDTDTKIPPFALLLDSDGEFSTVSGGPGPSPLVVAGQTIVAY